MSDKNSRLNINLLNSFNGNILYYTKKGFFKNENYLGDYILNEHNGDYINDLYFDKNKGIYKEFTSFSEKFNFLKE